MTMTTPTTPERLREPSADVVARLLLMADQGDYGRKPDPSDIRRRAAAMIEAQAKETASLQAEIAELRHALATLDVWPAWASSLLDIMREFTGERYGSDEEIDLPEELRNWLAGYRVEIERDASRTFLNKDKSNG